MSIIPQPNPIDHVFRFYKPENTYTTIVLPCFTSIPLSAYHDLFIQCSLPNAKPQIIENNQIQLDFKTPFGPEISVFNVYVYQDSYRNHMIACCQLMVYALTTLTDTVRTGVRKPINVPIFSNRRQQTVMVYSDEPEVCSEVTQRPIKLESSGSTNVQLTVKTFSSEQKDIVLNCVDTRTKQVIKSILLKLKSEAPRIKQSFVTKCAKGRDMWQKLPITNPFDKEIKVEIMSSKPDLVVPVKPKILLKPEETSHAVMYFKPFPRKAKREVFVFVNEAENEKSKFNHSYLVEVIYGDTK